MNLAKFNSVYFIGVGGIGMSALARYFVEIHKKVAGYDKTATPLTNDLKKIGVNIHFADTVEFIPDEFKSSEDTLVVYTPAVPKNHSELNYFLDNNFVVKKRSEVLGLITQDTFCYAVAGTHGKTTTSSILAHLLATANIPITAFLGGISEDFNSNYVFRGDEVSVVEADEFDRSFLKLSPNIACITSMDADHLDIYGSHSELIASFHEFANKIEEAGNLIVRNGLPIKGITYGIEDNSDYSIKNKRVENGSYVFDIKTPKQLIENVKFNKPGEHNLLNALAAFTMAVETKTPIDRLVEGLESFKGVQRRFSYRIKEENFVLIDDYAHHPTEINAVYQALTDVHPSLKLNVIFQPHLFSRTRDFADEFAASLSAFDTVRLLDIYPAREEPISGITSEWLLGKISKSDKKLVSKEELFNEINANRTGVYAMLGAGDIGQEIVKLTKQLTYEN
ncbi:UDP-N-acetylmuramate--L-alanine ligase [Croceivirga lutea]|uniref:UDP-N-acetylmuramate--L-alanine ligase n=1 Tax=Croceivirga lutea TaxID=1775167 RepID=UPI00163B2A95|nr:UDP-N-acetylmuramate--L-alanine ligase [Croceivirga lutea]GGG53217.1 UDP-N-acetylmuramate--L-alanine ligase [Croceivirga lutea]